MPKCQEKTNVFFIKKHLLLLKINASLLRFTMLCFVLIKIFKNIGKNLLEWQKNTNFAVRNFKEK